MNIPEGYQRIEGSERRIAPGARVIGPADPNEPVSVTIIVRRRPDGPPMPDMDYWTKTPPGQRKFLSHEEFAVRHGAAQADLDAVSNFAGNHGLTVVETSTARRTIVTSGTVGQISRAFAVELGVYESPLGKYRGREGVIHIPADLANIVEGVFGLDNRRVGGHDADPANTVPLSPGTVASPKHYNFPAVDQDGTVAAGNGTGQTIGIFALEGGYKTMRDPNNPNAPPKPTDINGYLNRDITPNLTAVGTNTYGMSMPGDIEVMQDICIAASIAPGAQIAIYFADHANQDGWINTIGRMIHPNPGDPMPSVISISSHLVSGDDLDTIGVDGVSTSTIDRLHQYFQDAAMLGITVFASSGDIGSSRDFNPDNIAHVGYPASDPMVTSCGGTTIGTDVNGQSVEVTWNDTAILDGQQLASGGGISYHFPVPSWQINPFVIDFIPPSVNPDKHRGRGVPDVAGNASGNSGYPMVITTFGPPKPFNARGTSAVAPLYAALMAVINANLSQNFGFLNPTLYYLGIARPFPPRPPFPFMDITEGNNQWQNNPLFYTAGPGWDACTGWGSINGSVLLQGLKQLTRENGWRWCKKCQGMFFSGTDFSTPAVTPSFPPPGPGHFHGVCPKDGQEHDASGSGAYAAVLGDNGRSQQGGWRLCHKCGIMFFAGNSTQGVCPADNRPHEAFQIDGKPTHYAAVIGGDGPGQQGLWKKCQKCQGMFFAGNPGQDFCPVSDPVNGQRHDGSLSDNYAMPWQA